MKKNIYVDYNEDNEIWRVRPFRGKVYYESKLLIMVILRGAIDAYSNKVRMLWWNKRNLLAGSLSFNDESLGE